MLAKPHYSLPQTTGHLHRFHAMIKPIGALCNLDCPYCFYLHKSDLLHHAPNSRMTDDLLEEHIRQYIQGQDADQVVFSWQGGEPTLLGLAFFQKVVALQAKHRKQFQRIENDLQTNGTLLTPEWAAFLKHHNFLVGLSIDGPADLHDKYRFTKNKSPTFPLVMAAAKLLQQHAVPFCALCVVNRHNAREPRRVYRFLTRDLGAQRVQFIPCVEPRDFKSTAPQHWNPDALPTVATPESLPGHPNSIVTDWSVDPNDWGSFLSQIWDDWFRRDYGKIHVNLFETAIAQSLGMPAQTCTQSEFCGKGLAIEHNGDVFSCDHYVYPEFRLGNIRDTHEAAMAYSDRQKNFGFAKHKTLPQYCRDCPHLKFCWGECPKNRLLKTPDNQPGLNYLCSGWKSFYHHIQQNLPEIHRRIQSRR